MAIKRFHGSDALFLASLVIILVGVGLRVNVYFQNRSLVMDEANLARNIVEKGYSDFFTSLDHGQSAPPLFSIVSKGIARIIGVNEYALRIPSLLAGILSLILLMILVRRMISAYPAQLYVLLIFAFSLPAIRFSSEFKQYAMDGSLALVFIFWAIQAQYEKFTKTSVLKWSICGTLAIWLSMPVIFVLAAIGIAFFIWTWKHGKSQVLNVLLTGVIWMTSFGIYYLLILHKDIDNQYLKTYHAQYFFSFFPTDHESFERSYNIIIDLFRTATDKTIISIIWAVITFVTGSVYLLIKKRFYAFLLLMPIFLCLVASQFHLYSMIGRLTFFMMPIIIMIIGIGISYLWSKSNLVFKVILVIPMLISVFNKGGYEYFWKKMEFEDSKSVMSYISDNRQVGELIYVQYDGVPAFVFYNELYDKAWGFRDYYLAGWKQTPAGVVPEAIKSTSSDRFWLFMSHTFPMEKVEENINSAKEVGIEIGGYESIQASAYYFRLKQGFPSM